MCEVEFRASDRRLSGAGVSLRVLEAACAYASGRLTSERDDDENLKLSVVIPGAQPVPGTIHDDCFFSFQPAPSQLVDGVCRAVLEQQGGYAGVQVGLQSVALSLAKLLHDHGCLRLRTDPGDMQITIEVVKSDSPLIGKRFRRIGRVRLDQPDAQVVI